MDQSALLQLLPLAALLVIMYFLLIRPQKKKENEVNKMRSNVKVGDDIITIGGIYGKVVKVKDDRLTIQVGADKTKFDITRWAVSKVENEAPVKSKISTKTEEEVEEAPKKSLPKRLKKSDEESDLPKDKDNPVEL